MVCFSPGSRVRDVCTTTAIPAKAEIQRGRATGKRPRTGPDFIIGEVKQTSPSRSVRGTRAGDAREGWGALRQSNTHPDRANSTAHNRVITY